MAIGLCANAGVACGATRDTTGKLARYVDPASYAYMYPYLSNQMRTELNPGTTVSMANNPIDIVVKTKAMSEPRRVVARTNKNARAATNSTASVATTTNARVATTPQTAQTNRRVVSRPGATVARTAAADSRATPRSGSTTATTTTILGGSSSQCLADYIDCMEGYCARENMAYNRCSCSARLAQIDSKYQPAINAMMTRIVALRAGGGNWTDEEMNEYWMERIGNYTGTNSWANLDNALNISWPTTDERMRGQNAFLTGHEYCVQHLRACTSMSSNMRDAYRSKISRDCNTYENALIKIKTAAESVIEYYSE